MKMDKKKVVFASVIALVISFIVGYSIYVVGGDENSGELQQTLVPELLETDQTFTSKKMAVDAIKD